MSNEPTPKEESPDNRRKFTRIPFDAKTEIEQGGQRWSATLIDLSLKGLLIEEPEEWPDDIDGFFNATIRLGPNVTIEMKLLHSHSEKHHIGFRCESIDLDSISHLRRMLELNMGNSDLLERELHSLG